MQPDVRATRGSAGECDIVRITPEQGDVVSNPSESRLLVQQTIVARGRMRGIFGGKRGVREEP